MKQGIQILKLGLAILFLATASPMLLAAPRVAGIQEHIPRSGDEHGRRHPQAPRDGGIQGRAALYISYGTPVEVESGVWIGVGDVMLPVSTSFRVLSKQGREVGKFSTDTNGEFTVSLRPGKYLILPDTLSVSALPSPYSISTSSFEVTVKAGKFTYALILYYHEGPFGIAAAGLTPLNDP